VFLFYTISLLIFALNELGEIFEYIYLMILSTRVCVFSLWKTNAIASHYHFAAVDLNQII
jgi:hypothetical protein